MTGGEHYHHSFVVILPSSLIYSYRVIIFAAHVLWWMLFRYLPMKKMPASLSAACERPALPVLPARSRSLVRPNC